MRHDPLLVPSDTPSQMLALNDILHTAVNKQSSNMAHAIVVETYIPSVPILNKVVRLILNGEP